MPPQQRALEAHAATCAACRTLTADLEAIRDAGHALERRDAVERRVGAHPAPAHRRTRVPEGRRPNAARASRSRGAQRALELAGARDGGQPRCIALVAGSLYVVNLSRTPAPRPTHRGARQRHVRRTRPIHRERAGSGGRALRESHRRSGAGGQRQRLAARSGIDDDVESESRGDRSGDQRQPDGAEGAAGEPAGAGKPLRGVPPAGKLLEGASAPAKRRLQYDRVLLLRNRYRMREAVQLHDELAREDAAVPAYVQIAAADAWSNT